jgi:phosphoadenosine phosphosulfate reductase
VALPRTPDNGTVPRLDDLRARSVEEQRAALADVNRELAALPAVARVRWAFTHLEGEFVLSSSFGIQAAVMLHMVTQVRPDIPVVVTDTGYLFPETYRFIDELTERLHLNLKIYRAKLSPAWQEARFGKLWEHGVEGLERYNKMNKVEPMARALKQLNARTWFSGLRREQAGSRRDLPISGCNAACSSSCRSSTGPTRTCTTTCRSLACRTIPCGSRGMSRSATCTARRSGRRG